MNSMMNELTQLRREISSILLRIEQLERQAMALKQAAEPEPMPKPTANPMLEPIQKPYPSSADPIPKPSPPPTPDPAKGFVWETDKTVFPEAVQRKSKEKNLEFRIGGTWLNRIGVVAVIFGLAYFLKYSFDNAWIGPIGRVTLGILAGLAMMGAGEKLRRRYPGYAQSLLGGGSLAIFFAVYTGYQFYQLFAPALAMIFLLIIMISTVFMAIRHKSLPIGLLGIVGAYAVPFMIGSDDPSLWMLYGYFALITLGVVAVSFYQKWMVFQYISFAFNLFIFLFTWIFADFAFWPMYVFLFFNFVMYLAVATLYNIRKQNKAAFWDISLTVLNAFSFFGFSLALLQHTWVADYQGFYAVLLGLLFVYLGRWSHRLFKEDRAQIFSLFLVAFVLITIAIPLQLSGSYIAIAWFAESVGLIYMGTKWNAVKLVPGGLVALFLGFMAAFGEIAATPIRQTFLLNVQTLLFICSLAAVWLILRLLRTNSVSSVLKGVFLSIVFIMITFENAQFFALQDFHYFISPEQLSLSALWIAYAVVLFAAGVRKNIRYLRYVALGLLGVVILKAFFIDLQNLATIYKILLFIFLGLCLLGISYFYQKKKNVLLEDAEG